jgi:hypothetical protein
MIVAANVGNIVNVGLGVFVVVTVGIGVRRLDGTAHRHIAETLQCMTQLRWSNREHDCRRIANETAPGMLIAPGMASGSNAAGYRQPLRVRSSRNWSAFSTAYPLTSLLK